MRMTKNILGSVEICLKVNPLILAFGIHVIFFFLSYQLQGNEHISEEHFVCHFLLK